MQRHKILAFIIALIVSVCLWAYAVTVVNPDDKKSINDIHVRVTGSTSLESSGLILMDGGDQFVDVEISGRRSDLKYLNSSNMEAIADVRNIERPGTYEVSWELSVPSAVASGDIKLLSSSSDRIKVTVSERRDREIPIAVEYTDGKPAAGYVSGDEILSIEDEQVNTIVVSGPAEEVEQIENAVVYLDLTDATTKIDEDLPYIFRNKKGEDLELSNYVKYPTETKTIHVNVPIYAYKDVKISVSVIEGGGLLAEDVSLDLNIENIRVTAGDRETLDAMPDEHKIVIDLAKVEGVGEIKLPYLYELPKGVTSWGGENGSNIVNLEVTLTTAEDIEIYRVPLGKTKLEIVNGERNMDYSYANPDLTLEVRGHRKQLNALRRYLDNHIGDLVVTVDILQMDENTSNYPMVVTMPEKFDVGLFKEYSTALIKTRRELPQE